MKQLFSYKNNFKPALIKSVDGKKGIVTGYFSAFNNVDADGDIIRPGAFTKTIAEKGPNSAQPRIKHLFNHNTSQPLGVLMTLSEDSTGLAYESQIGTHTLGQDFVKMVESNLITEHSIGFRTIKKNQLQDYEGYMKNPSAGWFEIKEIELWEGSSLTSWGANQNTPLTSLKTKGQKEIVADLIVRQKNIEKFCRNTTASDETIELLLIECKQLTQIILEKSTMPDMVECPTCGEDTPDEPDDDGMIKCQKCDTVFTMLKSTLPVVNKNWLEAIKTFSNSLKN